MRENAPRRWFVALAGLGVAALGLATLSRTDELTVLWHARRLGSASPNERLGAARRLGELKNLRSVPPLVEALRRETDSKVREALILTLGEMGPRLGPDAISALVDSLASYRMFLG